jgi:hypothetical protein
VASAAIGAFGGLFLFGFFFLHERIL